MIRRAKLATLTLGVLALAACGNGEVTVDPATEDAATTTTAAPPTSAAPTTEAAPTFTQMNLGDTLTTPRGNKITAHEVKQRIPWDFEPDGTGQAWYAIDVEYCLGENLPDLDVFQQFPYEWTLSSEQGWTMNYPTSYSSDIAQPALDLYTTTPKPNTCYRGWVLIDGPADAKITSADIPEASWTVPAEE